MLPTFREDGDILLVDRLSHRLGRLKVGDVVEFASPTRPEVSLAQAPHREGG